MNKRKGVGHKMKIPMLILREMVLMPGTTVHFDIQQENSIQAVNVAMQNNSLIFVVTAKATSINENMTMEQVHSVGTLALVRQILKLPKGQVRVLVNGVSRGQLHNIINDSLYHVADVIPIEKEIDIPKTEQTARIRIIKDLLKKYTKNRTNNDNTVKALSKIRNLQTLIDLTTEAVPLPFSSKQEVLEELDLVKRSEVLTSILMNEIEIMQIRDEIGEKLKDCVNQNQREYVLREQMKLIRKELGEENAEDEGDHYENELNRVNPPQEVREKLEKEIKRFRSLFYSSSESAVLRNYIETVLEYPWNQEGEDNQNLQTVEC